MSSRDDAGQVQFELKEPDTTKCTVGWGRTLVGNGSKLSALLRDTHTTEGVGEQMGKLLKWWKIVDRAYSFHGLFQHLKDEKKKEKKRKKSMSFNEFSRLSNKIRGRCK